MLIACAAWPSAAAAAPKSAARSVAKPRRAPAGLAFYKPPKGFAKTRGAKHGDLIWARRISGPEALPSAAATYVVLYRSSSISGRTIAVSGLVSIPPGRAPKSGFPVISYAHGTTGSADVCAPSRDTSTAGDPVQHLLIEYANPVLDSWLKHGYAVLRTDYEGLGTPGPHPYLIGRSEGRSVIDIVRAARQLTPKLGRRWAIAGHSQGGHAALWAAADAPKWAPDLRLVGVVAFAPASHVRALVDAAAALTRPNPFLSAEGALLLAGAAAASKSVVPARVFSDATLALLPQIEQQCLPGLARATSFGGLPPSALLRPGADVAPLTAVLGANDPGGLRIAAPSLILQGDKDTTVYPAFTTGLAAQLTALGDRVTLSVIPGIDHLGVVAAGAPAATSFFAARFGR